MFRSFIATIAVLSVFVAMAAGEAPLPRPWSRSLFSTPPYRAGLDWAVLYKDQPSLFISAGFPHPTQLGPGLFTAKFSVTSGLQQAIKADRYRAQRVRWSGYLRTLDVGSVWNDDPTGETRTVASRDSSPGAGLYVVIDSRDAIVLYAMTRDRLTGAHDWTKVDMVFDVPSQSVLITLGVFLAGQGQLWASGFAFEEVSSSVPSTSDLDLTSTQIYDYTFARHKKRLKEYRRSPDVPVLQLQGRGSKTP